MALIIFDLDGTLLDSIEGLAVAGNMMLEDFGFEPHPHENYKLYVGNGIRMTVERALPKGYKDLTDKGLEVMIKHYKTHYVDGLKAYEGIHDLLDTLAAKGHTLAMVTNKFQFMADVIMPEYFGDHPFVTSIGRSEDHPAKPDPTTILAIIEAQGFDKKDVYMIGDTEVDLAVARNAGINEVFVTWGFRKLHEIEDWQPKLIIDKPSELIDILD